MLQQMDAEDVGVGAHSGRLRIERLPNGLLRVFDLASKLSACYAPDGAYAHGDLCAPTLRELLCSAQQGKGEER